jgi:hypothetical protein
VQCSKGWLKDVARSTRGEVVEEVRKFRSGRGVYIYSLKVTITWLEGLKYPGRLELRGRVYFDLEVRSLGQG